MNAPTASAARIGGISLLRLQSDERLVDLASAGVETAFEELVRRYRGALLRSCRRLLPDDQAEDAVQQALLDAHRALTRNGSPDRFRPWLNRIAVNSALKQLHENGETVPLSEEINGVEGPEQVHERRESLRRAVHAIQGLPAHQRQALVLRELEGRSHADIAREMGLSGGAVRQLIYRARNSVRSAASALIPPPFLTRLLGAGGGSPPVAEVAAGGAGGAVVAKVAIAAMVTGGVAGGVALESRDGRGSTTGAGPERAEANVGGGPTASQLDADASGSRSAGSGSSDRSGSNSGSGGGEGGSSGGGSGSSGDGSGSGSSGSESSGSGSGDELEAEEDSSGSDSSGSGSSGSGSGSSGSGSSGSDSSGSGSGSLDSGSSGSGSSGSDSSGSGSSGSGSGESISSGSSGSGSSGSGSGDLDDD